MDKKVLKNAKKLFRETPQKAINWGGEELEEFCGLIASVISDKVSVDGLLLSVELLLKDIERGECGFHTSGYTQYSFKNVLERRGQLHFIFGGLPRIIDMIADKEFASEFRERYGREVLGKEANKQEEQDYGCIEIDEHTIDISNKNKADVLAALYNASQPVGMGFAQYNPAPMTRELAEYVLEKMGTSFSYLKGRPLYIQLNGDKLYVGAYNRDNRKGLAQQAISKCPNLFEIEVPKKEVQETVIESIEEAISEKQRQKELAARRTPSGNIDFRQQTTLLPMRRFIQEEGEDISRETINFIKDVEDRAYPEEMKLLQDMEDVEDLASIYDAEVKNLTVARNNDWYIVLTEDEDSIEIVDIAALPYRNREASRREINNYLVRVMNVRASNLNKIIRLNAKEDTSYRMIQRMVNNGDYEIIENTPNFFDDDETIQMHYLILRPIIQIDRDR